jgi:hypothetical protein
MGPTTHTNYFFQHLHFIKKSFPSASPASVQSNDLTPFAAVKSDTMKKELEMYDPFVRWRPLLNWTISTEITHRSRLPDATPLRDLDVLSLILDVSSIVFNRFSLRDGNLQLQPRSHLFRRRV